MNPGEVFQVLAILATYAAFLALLMPSVCPITRKSFHLNRPANPPLRTPPPPKMPAVAPPKKEGNRQGSRVIVCGGCGTIKGVRL